LKRQLNVVIISLSLALLMTQFQNCAGPSNYTPGSADTVHLIDGNASLQFAIPEAHLSEQASAVQLGGLCDQSHNGQSFNWAVTVSNSVFATGSGTCDNGQFSVDLSTAQNLICGVSYQVGVTASWGTAQMNVDKLCEPLASSSLPNSTTSYGQPQTCQMEYRLSSDGSDQGLCQAVCFQNEIMSSQEDLPLDDCESLIVQVSGL